MTDDDRKRIQARVREEITKTREAVTAQQSDGKSIAPDNAVGRVSRMDSMYTQQVNAGALKRNRARIGKLEYVLSLVDTPKFGRCEFCGDPIPVERLKAMPESTTCMRCAAFAE